MHTQNPQPNSATNQVRPRSAVFALVHWCMKPTTLTSIMTRACCSVVVSKINFLRDRSKLQQNPVKFVCTARTRWTHQRVSLCAWPLENNASNKDISGLWKTVRSFSELQRTKHKEKSSNASTPRNMTRENFACFRQSLFLLALDVMSKHSSRVVFAVLLVRLFFHN